MKIAFDIGGVLSKYPDILRPFAKALIASGVDVYVLTDMQPHELVIETLVLNGFDFIDPARVVVADYTEHGEGCKAELLCALNIDIMLDDFVGYLADRSCPIRCLVMPDSARPYYHESWKCVGGEADFGRRVWKRKEQPSKLGEVEAERDAYRAMLADLVAERPDPTPAVWIRARELLKLGPVTKGQEEA